MIFSELYSAYYNAVARVIGKILEGEKNPKKLQSVVSNNAFDESAVAIFAAIKNEKWHLISPDMTTPIEHIPTMPLTVLEKRWLKAISLDPRVQLFDIDFPELDGVDPLFTPDDYRVYDKYSDGDPFSDEEYIKKFRTILTAMRGGKQIKFEMENRNRAYSYVRCIPERLEYSEKDDKFRIITGGSRVVSTVNIAKMRFCSIYHGSEPLTKRLNRPTQHQWVTLRISDRRNALERVMMHFAHFEKQAERVDAETYLLKIKYDVKDESEILIRVLSFGPMVEVIEPQPFIDLIREKLARQMKLGLK